MAVLDVYLGETRAGTLTADGEGQMTFAYIDATAPALSLSLPPRVEPYADRECRPFFAGLLPEGDALRRAADSRRLQIYETFRLLESFGGECAGAVRLLPEGNAPAIPHDYQPLDDTALGDVLADIDRAPNFARDRRVRLSVAGVQGKTAVKLTAKGIAKPLNGSPSTHILKVGNERYPTLPQNEAFCLHLAVALGLDAARCELRHAGDRPFLLVERYDRAVDNGRVRELHQEDFCQALGFPPERKYEIDETGGDKIGPGFADCFGLIDRTRQPALDRLELLRRVLFNYLIANADAHAKNFSLLYSDGGAPRLAPAYDLVCTALYEHLTDDFAMRHGGIRHPDEMTRESWDALARDIGMTPRLLHDEAHTLAKAIIPAAKHLMQPPFSRHAPYAHIVNVIGERVRALADALSLAIDVDTPPPVLRAPGWSGPAS